MLGNSGNQFKVDSCRRQLRRFGSAGAKIIRVAASKPNDDLLVCGLGQHQFESPTLFLVSVFERITTENPLCRWRAEFEHFFPNQRVVNNDAGLAEQFRATERERSSVGASGADHIDFQIHPTHFRGSARSVQSC